MQTISKTDFEIMLEFTQQLDVYIRQHYDVQWMTRANYASACLHVYEQLERTTPQTKGFIETWIELGPQWIEEFRANNDHNR